jgi:DNA repair protein RadA/Sms
MAKSSTAFVCQSCGAVTSRWSGKCDSCNEWNSIVEERVKEVVPKGLGGSKKGCAVKFSDLKREDTKKLPRRVTGIKEFDRVTGGGFVPGSAILIGGDPGIGKSTLLLQSVCALSNKGERCTYISGEESVEQVRLRAERMGLSESPVNLAYATNVRDIIASMEAAETPMDFLIIDSIQTMYVDNIDSAPGTVSQVRTSAHEIVRAAKRLGITVIFVGHVTKDGQIAGPRVLEHMVDTVLYFEGDKSHQFRILRGVKNRFGPTDEIGVFEMASQGLIEVDNPSELFLAQRQRDVNGSAVLAAMEGTRPVLVEVQALVAPSSLATPRRAVIGWDSARLAMVLAVLEARCGIQLSGSDIFLNIAGGIKIAEPAVDVAVAAALISSVSGVSVPDDMVMFGEIGLAGEIRQVSQAETRIKEAAKLGFGSALVPKNMSDKKKPSKSHDLLDVRTISHVQDIISLLSDAKNVSRYAQA